MSVDCFRLYWLYGAGRWLTCFLVIGWHCYCRNCWNELALARVWLWWVTGWSRGGKGEGLTFAGVWCAPSPIEKIHSFITTTFPDLWPIHVGVHFWPVWFICESFSTRDAAMLDMRGCLLYWSLQRKRPCPGCRANVHLCSSTFFFCPVERPSARLQKISLLPAGAVFAPHLFL